MKQALNSMINAQLLLLAAVCIILFSGTATADLYSWTDENGKRRYTTSPPPTNQNNVTITPIKQKTNNSEKVVKSVKQPMAPIKTSKTKESAVGNINATEKELECVWNGMWGALTEGKKGHPSDCVSPNSK